MYKSIISEEGKRRIFEGELIPQFSKNGAAVNHYRVKGFRHESESLLTVTGNRVIESTRKAPDASGVYIAKVIVKDVKGNAHHFFPREWTAEQVLNAIAEAYVTKAPHVGGDAGVYAIGSSRSGMRIVMELDAAGLVADAFPLKRSTSKSRAARWMIEEGRLKRSRHICGVCKCTKARVCLNGHNLPAELRHRTLIGRAISYLRGLIAQSLSEYRKEKRCHTESHLPG